MPHPVIGLTRIADDGPEGEAPLPLGCLPRTPTSLCPHPYETRPYLSRGFVRDCARLARVVTVNGGVSRTGVAMTRRSGTGRRVCMR
jgi:hypothetical protein